MTLDLSTRVDSTTKQVWELKEQCSADHARTAPVMGWREGVMDTDTLTANSPPSKATFSVKMLASVATSFSSSLT